jgi:hypothetical protein
MDGLSLIFGIGGAIICGFAGGHIMKSKGRSAGAGAALGVLLGVIGLLITLAISPKDEGAARKAGPSNARPIYAHRDAPGQSYIDWR